MEEKKVYGVQVTFYTWEDDLDNFIMSKFCCDNVIFQNNCVLLMRDRCRTVERITLDRVISIEAVKG